MDGSQPAVQLLEQGANEEEKLSMEEIHEQIDEKYRSVFSLQKHEELPEFKTISENIPPLYQFDSKQCWPRILLSAQIGSAFIKFLIFLLLNYLFLLSLASLPMVFFYFYIFLLLWFHFSN